MLVTHQYKNTKVQKKIDKDASLILGNNLGNYLYLAGKNKTKYQGFFYADYASREMGSEKNRLEIYKVIDEISILDEGDVVGIKNKFFGVEKEYESGLVEKYFLPDDCNSLCFRTNKKIRAEIILDARHPYNLNGTEKFYSMEIKKDCALIKFAKGAGCQKNILENKKEFTLYVAIKTDQDKYRKIEKFFSKYCQKDQKRNSYPWNIFVYRVLEMEFERAVFSVSRNPDDAVKEAKMVFNNFEKLQNKKKSVVYKKLKPLKISDTEIKMAHLSAQNSLSAMMVENKSVKGAYAGLPWFFQFWSRDEAISLLEICKLDKKLAEHIILSQLDAISYDGQIPSLRSCKLKDKNIKSADALGWLADRILKMINKNELPEDLKIDIAEVFEQVVSSLIQNRTDDDLAINLKNETWMDSLERSGARIEIQAGRLRIYDLIYNLTKNDQYQILRDELKSKVRDKFYKDGVLLDGLEDKTVRPNVFLAAYLYPELLDRKEWEVCFDKILPSLYLEWGGLSSVDKNSDDFISEDTGENSASYHNGNSWYWVNNLTALVLYRINADKYSKYINAIMEASTREILYGGAIGHHSEISSAKKQTSSGCGTQLWSSAMYLEVFDEILKTANLEF